MAILLNNELDITLHYLGTSHNFTKSRLYFVYMEFKQTMVAGEERV